MNPMSSSQPNLFAVELTDLRAAAVTVDSPASGDRAAVTGFRAETLSGKRFACRLAANGRDLYENHIGSNCDGHKPAVGVGIPLCSR